MATSVTSSMQTPVLLPKDQEAESSTPVEVDAVSAPGATRLESLPSPLPANSDVHSPQALAESASPHPSCATDTDKLSLHLPPADQRQPSPRQKDGASPRVERVFVNMYLLSSERELKVVGEALALTVTAVTDCGEAGEGAVGDKSPLAGWSSPISEVKPLGDWRLQRRQTWAEETAAAAAASPQKKKT